MKKKKPKRFIVRNDTWNGSIHVFAGTSPKEARKKFNVLLDDPSEVAPHPVEMDCFLAWAEGRNVYVMWFSESSPGVGAITHEAIHAAWRMLDLRGVTLTVDNHEPLAYLTEWIVKEIGRKVW